MKSCTRRFSIRCEMDTKLEIKNEDSPTDNVDSQNEREFFTKIVKMKTNSDAVLQDENCDIEAKTEIKSEPTFADLCSLRDTECCAKHVQKLIKSESVTCSSSSSRCEIDVKTDVEEQIVDSDFGSWYNREFILEDSVTEVKTDIVDHEVDNKIAIKEELGWLESERSSVYYDIKVGNFSSAKSPRLGCTPRLCSTEVSNDNSNKSPLSSAKQNVSLHKSEHQQNNIAEIPAVEPMHSKPYDKCRGVGESYNRTSYLKQKNLIQHGRTHKCKICGKRFSLLKDLKKHQLNHDNRKQHKCKTCGKSFTWLSGLRLHNLTHEGKKPHKCEMCQKSFTQIQTLIRHQLIHEGKKSHKCKICDKSFTHLSTLKSHTLIHEGRRPYTCEICDKSFTQLPHLKSHTLGHVGIKPYKCEICDKRFTRLFTLKNHILIHEGKTPYKCEICSKSFTRLSYLKRHNLIHQYKKLV